MKDFKLTLPDLESATCPGCTSDFFVVLYKIKTGELIVQSIKSYIESNVSLIFGKLPLEKLITQVYILLDVASTRPEAEGVLKTMRGKIS